MSRARPERQLFSRRFYEGATDLELGTCAEVRYFGVVKRIPFTAFPNQRGKLETLNMEWDETFDSMSEDLPATLPVSMQGWEPIPQAPIERLEAFDRETGDLVVFWRVPCRRKG